MTFSAYVHARPDTVNASGIFYVGKGREKRVKKVARRNPHHKNIVNKYGRENILIGKLECSSEDIAFELEKGLIKCLKRMGVKLTNLTDGGDGVSGRVPYTRGSPSTITRELISRANKGKTPWNKGVPSKLIDVPRSLEVIAKISESRLGRKWVNDGTEAKCVHPDQLGHFLDHGWLMGKGSYPSKKGKR